MAKEYFTVDAKLLRELGERLVGRPHIALAELIKNAYDADARQVEIHFGGAYIEIRDDGHGMSRSAFADRWMRIGTVHKAAQRLSPELGRGLTGSKGVGRLSAQLLARSLELDSVALRDPSMRGIAARRGAGGPEVFPQVSASINWDEAVRNKDLTSVAVDVSTGRLTRKYAANSNVGTRLVLRDLTIDWDADRFRRLAREIWSLQPPFDVDSDSERSFRVVMSSDEQHVEDAFATQMTAVLDIWSARVTARLREDRGDEVTFELSSDDARGRRATPAPGTSRILDVFLELRDQPARAFAIRVPDSPISQLDYEIRVFDLVNRQPKGVRVEEARGYLREFGGVHIYDTGFRLPYYGADEDWLGIETYHSHRLSRLRLLPENMQAPDAANDIPTNNRIFGFARISTGAESANAEVVGLDAQRTLTIQVTRDRLVDNEAFALLRRLVSVALDLYALERARRRTAERGLLRPSGEREPRPSSGFGEALEIIRSSKHVLPPDTFARVEKTLAEAVEDTSRLEQAKRAHSALLGALATAGMTALAYEHESSKQRALIARSAKSLRLLAKTLEGRQAEKVSHVVKQLQEWTDRADRLRGLFSPLLDEADRTEVVSYSARGLVEDVAEHVKILARGTAVRVVCDDDSIRLPPASYAAWTSVFQNLLINAFNATLKTTQREVLVHVGSGVPGGAGSVWVRVEDTGVGVDLSEAERFFEPFERQGLVDIEAAALGLGGSGLGLTIVRMIAGEVGARVSFEQPSRGYSTCAQVTWRA